MVLLLELSCNKVNGKQSSMRNGVSSNESS